MKALIKIILFLVCAWTSGSWLLDVVKRDYACFTVFPDVEDLESCRELVRQMDWVNDPMLLERVMEANSGVLFLSFSFYLIMSFISLTIIYLILRKKRMN